MIGRNKVNESESTLSSNARTLKAIKPVIFSAISFIAGEFLTSRLSQAFFNTDEYDFIYKAILGLGIVGYSAAHRITDQRIESESKLTAAAISELLGIAYLYSSSFRASRNVFDGTLDDRYSLIASLGISALAVPGAISYLVRKVQEKSVKSVYAKGAQRSDTAVISSGLTSVANTYFQLNHFLLSEMTPVSRLFQLGLISDNILNAASFVQQFRNLPALIADAGPRIVKNIILQQDKIENDYKHNTTLQKVLKFTNGKPGFFNVERSKLRNNDLVLCDESLDLSSSPVAGEIVSFKRDDKANFTEVLDSKKFSINLKAHNGEDYWIEYKTNANALEMPGKMSLHAIRDGKQAGVLTGAKLNLYDGDGIFVRIKEEMERVSTNNYEKHSVINKIIAEHKQRNVLYSVISSIVMSGLLTRDLSLMPVRALQLLFGLTQMMIPFSESFFREMVNKRLMKDINQNLGADDLSTIDALRIVDLCNAMSGYYRDRFPQGVAIVSDKTGTLTTSKMDVLGVWTDDMSSGVSALLNADDAILLPQKDRQAAAFDVFASAYTNNKKELEPEEFAILQMFSTLFHNDNVLTIHVQGNNHFKKNYLLDSKEKTIETMHLGLYKKLGGRLTLVSDGEHRYLVFCGVPRADKFSDSDLLKSYQTMQVRTGVLSRDWCVARAEISEGQFNTIKALFDKDSKHTIESFVLSDSDLLKKFSHKGTFIVNNPVKKSAEKFISQCKNVRVPVFVATGDTAKNAENIAKVLCPASSQHIITVRSENIYEWTNRDFPLHSTVIFAGINDDIMAMFKRLMQMTINERPVIIFSEMSTKDKGILTKELKKNGYFVVANGDGSNDISMMKSADLVIAHLTEDGTYAPGVSQLANLNDKQVGKLFNSDNSFYELFDIHKKNSQFVKLFMPLVNSQEKPSISLILKTSKMSFEMAKALGVSDVKEMYQQHWFTVGFDLIWLWLSYQKILGTTDTRVDTQHLSMSDFAGKSMLAAICVAAMQSILAYQLSGESTNIKWMALMLFSLNFILNKLYTSEKQATIEVLPDQDRLLLSDKLQGAQAKDNTIGLFATRNRLLIKDDKTSEQSEFVKSVMRDLRC